MNIDFTKQKYVNKAFVFIPLTLLIIILTLNNFILLPKSSYKFNDRNLKQISEACTAEALDNVTDKCQFVRYECEEDNLIPYLQFYYCYNHHFLWYIFVILLFAFLIYEIAYTCHNYFVIIIQKLSLALKNINRCSCCNLNLLVMVQLMYLLLLLHFKVMLI